MSKAGGCAKEDNSPGRSDDPDSCLDRVPTRTVNHHIRSTISHLLYAPPPLCIVIDGTASGAEFEGAGDLLFASGGNEDLCAELTRNLQREEGDATTDSSNQHLFTRPNSSSCDNSAPGGEAGKRQRGGLFHREMGRTWLQIDGRNADQFGECSIIGHSKDPIPGRL